MIAAAEPAAIKAHAASRRWSNLRLLSAVLSPVWHLLDLAPHGRGDWYPSLNY